MLPALGLAGRTGKREAANYKAVMRLGKSRFLASG